LLTLRILDSGSHPAKGDLAGMTGFSQIVTQPVKGGEFGAAVIDPYLLMLVLLKAGYKWI
jgi:hypothetical protein